MPIDLAAAREAFAHSQDGTVGLEEEFAIVDPETLELLPRFEELRDEAPSELARQITGELIRAEIEIVSGRGEDFRDALARQRAMRRLLFAHAAESGVALGATATHPFADYREQEFIDTEHYRRVAQGLQWVARRNNTFSLHVHVGVSGPDRAVRTCDRLRPVLPTLLAISASSPFMDGVDTGLHSARTQMFTRTFPRCGVPDAFGSWDAYADYVDLLVRTRSIVEYTQVWWSVRPHFSFGTVEVRICDVQTTAAESEAVAALAVGCALQAARDEAEGVPHADLPPRLIEENLWRAIRFGMDGRLLDLERGEEVDARAALERLLAWSAPARADHGIPDPAFPERNSAQRQRALVAEGLSPREVYAATVRETRATYGAQEVPTA
ncbi:MAG TPA: YbdK family carboxylate-amine ligase [Solirubrobacteraceae bacterium]|jgi:carboxylate-amine ligase|nr:YbdK family carboxylate-amine ligase [Solirubrobacteraceae bacterium]